MMEIIESLKAPQPVGAYSQAIKTKNFLYLSGQIGIDRNIGSIVEGGIEEETKQAIKNIQYILSEASLSITNIIKVTVLLSDINDFKAMNEVYEESFKGHYPSRSAFAVSGLPKGALVEIEVIAEV